jgi:hypothetical protein
MILNNANNIKYGAIQAKKIMRGDNLIWEALLLDLFPNATVAYSLRKLINRYDGFAIRVRRASDNAEINIGFLDKDLDITTLETFCSGTDGFVTTWYDQSGNENDAIQTTAINQPKIVSVGNLILENGVASIDFDGSNDALFNASFKLNPAPFTLFFVNKFKNIIGIQSIIDQSQGTTAGFLYRINASQNNYYYYPQIVNINTSSANANQNLTTFFVSNGNQNEFVNGNSSFNDTKSITSNPIPTNNFFIGNDPDVSPRAASILLQEMIIFKSNELGNRLEIENNINNYYSIY